MNQWQLITKSINQNRWRKRRSRGSTCKKGNRSMKSGPVNHWNPQLEFVIKIKPSVAHSFQDILWDQQVFLYTLPCFIPPFVQIFTAQLDKTRVVTVILWKGAWTKPFPGSFPTNVFMILCSARSRYKRSRKHRSNKSSETLSAVCVC